MLRTNNSSISIADLACELGFYDQSHFTHEFKQVIGITPGQFRNKIKNEP
ncbi:helix-turn-helix domain-containing protein [Catenovulum sediminis]|nr:AraC family transcriptional regulator [Catenovulum sediminis]